MTGDAVNGGAFGAVLRRDLSLAFRARGDIIHPILFYVITVSLFPFAISSNPEVLWAIGPGVIWVCALLATLLSLDAMFRTDFDDGSLEQLLLGRHPLVVVVLAKVAAHWLVTGLPLILVSPALAVLLALPGHAHGVLVASLALGTPVLSLVGAIGVGLTVGLRRGGGLLSLLVLPLYVPVLIFGAYAVTAATKELSATGPLLMLGAFLSLALALAPFAAAAALRISVE